MIFNSVEFFIFLPIVLSLFYITNYKFRWIILLLASYIFYAGWKEEFLLLIIYSTLVDFFISRGIYKSTSKSRKKLLLGLSLFSNFGALILFKYFHFFIGGASWFKELAESNDTILWLEFVFNYGIPVGISFYTFQTVSYTVDVYKGRIKPENNLGKFALFVSFFPQLVAGPIERFSSLHPQLFKKFIPSKEDFRQFFQLALYGFFLKLVIADNLGLVVNPVFDNYLGYSIPSKLIASIGFGFQIYADFFGYTLIAIGVASLFGVRLQNNFKSPYFALSIKSFWSKWHISLSTWFRDYLYIPLGGNAKGKGRWIIAIFITFLLSGLWHGASANFLWWGLIHGGLYLIEQLTPILKKEPKQMLSKVFRWAMTFTVVMIAWVFFRSTDMKFVENFFGENEGGFIFNASHWFLLLPIALFFLLETVQRNLRLDNLLKDKSVIVRWAVYSTLIVSILLLSSEENLEFIYFQF